ncbi:MAG: Cys-Gln thioester bond-forming surface protein [Ruminococcus sp.]|nr:Cys-Gln thioester bond-forming surface protein [Ruminococcus sp.]
MIKRGLTKTLSLLLALTVIILNFFSLGAVTAYAAVGEKADIYMVEFPRENDANHSGWGHEDLQYMNGWHTGGASNTMALRAIGSYTGKICYCIEPGTGQHTGDTFTQKDENFWNNFPSEYNRTIDGDQIKIFIGRILQYGYTGNLSTEWKSQDASGADKLSFAIATQLLVWETIVGERDENFNHVDTGSCNRVLDCIKGNNPIRSQILNHYSEIEHSVKNHTKVPSFCAKSTGKAQTIEMQWDGKQYISVLTDSNNVLSNYSFHCNMPSVSFTVNGNELTVTSNTAPKEEITVTAEKNGSQRKGLITWTDGIYTPGKGSQDTVTYAQSVNDPVKAHVKFKVSYGSAKIVKTSEDGNVDGISFHIQGNGVDKTVKTANGGQIQIDSLKPGVYTVTEQTENKYEPQEIRRVTVVSGQTATVNFNNKLKRGNLTVTKTSEDGLNEGVKFHLYGTSLSGLKVDEYAVTDKSGKAYFKDILIGSGYTLEETDTAIRYVVPDKQTADIEWNKVADKSFHNILKKWQLTVTKSDKENGTPQGDASLAGAKYGVYKGDQLIDIYTTDSNGQFTTKYYVCDSDWTLREITPSEGYLVNTESLHIGAEAKLYTVEYNSTALDALETVQKGKIAVIKHCDDGSTQIETPEKDAEFEVYLKKSGSYGQAKESERDILVCDENGFAETKLLPYGIYTVRQTKGSVGKELMKPFDVFVGKDGEIYRYLINNATFKSLIEIVKKDAETGKIIPASGIGFKVRNTDTGKYIVQHINYPTPADIDIYYTDSTGKLMLPEALPYGNYEIIEQNTCYGYVLDSSPVSFKVDGSKTVVTVEKHNTAQKGKITVSKSGEVFSSVTESDGIYQPVYAVKGLQGAVYEITISEDIYTLDGTLRYAKGTVVDEITTGKDGRATSKPLYLGKYEIREIKAPYGMILNDESQTVELTYAGQDVSITETSAEFCNERQKAEISLSKVLEQNETFGIGDNGEILSVQFGLFADEDLKTADGSVIPKDGLLEIVNCDENGKAVFITDIPVGAKLYVKEISTDSHYLLSDEKYPVVFEYAGQHVATVNLSVNNGEPIENDLIYGTVKGLKIDRETDETITGALFGLFKADETEFTEKTAILLAESNENGIFTFENVPFGEWTVKELQPADGYLENTDIHHIQIGGNEQIIEITAVNDHVPETVLLPVLDIPQTGDDRNLGFWFGLGAVALGGILSAGIMAIKSKRDDEDA